MTVTLRSLNRALSHLGLILVIEVDRPGESDPSINFEPTKLRLMTLSAYRRAYPITP